MDIKSAELPLGSAKLIIEPTKAGSYNLFIKTAAGNQSQVMTILAGISVFRGKEYEDFIAKINADFDDPSIVHCEMLLNPDNRPSVCQLPNGRLYCRECHCYVPNTANTEMRKEGCFAHSHVCGVKQPDEIYLTPNEYPNI